MAHSSLRVLGLPALLLLALGPTARAQFTPANSNAIQWPTGSDYSVGQAFKTSVAGDFNGDGALDAVLRRGSRAYYLDAPGVRDAVVPLSYTVRGVATIRGHFGVGHDALATVGLSGLRIVGILPDQAGVPYIDVQDLDTNLWLGARLVAAADLDGDGDDDLTGVLSDRRTVRHFRNNGGNFQSIAGFTLTDDVLDFAPVQWESSSTVPELAFLFPDRLVIYTATGDPLATKPFSQAPRALAVASRPGGSDRVAVVLAGNEGDLLFVTSEAGDEDPVALHAEVHALATGRTGEVLDQGLATNATDQHELVLYPPGSDPSFDPTGAVPYLLGPTGAYSPTNLSRPLIGAFHGPGPHGLLVGIETTESVALWRGPLLPGYATEIPPHEVPVAPSCYELDYFDSSNEHFLGWARLVLKLEIHASEYSYVQVIAWYRESPGVFNELDAQSHTLHTIDEIPKDGDVYLLDVPLALDPEDADDRYYLEVRLLTSGPNLQTSDALVDAFSLLGSSLEGVPPLEPDWTEPMGVAPCNMSSGSGTGHILTQRVGRFPGGGVPNPGTPRPIVYQPPPD